MNLTHTNIKSSDDAWDTKDAQVVCRTLGFSTEGAVATSRSKFGKVSTDFIMDDVYCDGTESHIGLCTHIGTHNCGSTEGAGVICQYDQSRGKDFSLPINKSFVCLFQ